MKRISLLLCLVFCVVASAPARAALPDDGRRAALHKSLNEVAAKSIAPFGRYGIYVKSMSSTEVLYTKNGQAPLIPASNMKMVTSAAALARLGPWFTFETLVRGKRTVPEKIEGNLYLVGGGDPTFSTPFFSHATLPLEELANSLQRAGVSEVSGDLVGDDSVFDRKYLGQGWKSRYLMDRYAAPCGGLSLNRNLVKLSVTSDGVFVEPFSALVPVEDCTNGSGRFRYLRGSDRIVLKGSRPASFSTVFPVADPSLFTLGAFAEILKEAGIKVGGKTRLISQAEASSPGDGLEELARWESPNLIEILGYMNKESQNFVAEQVFKRLGKELHGRGTRENSQRAIREFIAGAGVSTQGLSIADGSGLSEENRISVQQLAGVLEHMYNHPHGQLYLNSLAYAGVEGTMEDRLAGAKVLAKTGTLRSVTALSGYLETERGETLIFCIMTNLTKGSVSRAKSVENRIVRILAKY